MQNTFKDLEKFISESPIGVALKVFAATGLTWLVDNIGDFGWPPVLVVAIPPAIVVLVDWLNGQDKRFGRKSDD